MIRAAVLGSPISHSLSPTLHTRAYAELGIDGRYEAIEVGPGELKKFIDDIAGGWTGFSLTMPLKEEAIPIASEISDIARQVASANTLVVTKSGWSATSTDVNGFKEALASHIELDFERVVILGSGATARAVAAACDTFAKEITVIHRSEKRVIAMQNSAPNTTLTFSTWDSPLLPTDLIVNTTPSGVADIFVDRIPDSFSGVFFEALYNPWPTKLLRHFREKGYLGIDGLDFLIHQGIDQIELMSGVKINLEERKSLAPILRSACLVKLER
ncbi:MAG: shikimate dehydrogenase [Actinomycetota bacterium]